MQVITHETIREKYSTLYRLLTLDELPWPDQNIKYIKSFQGDPFKIYDVIEKTFTNLKFGDKLLMRLEKSLENNKAYNLWVNGISLYKEKNIETIITKIFGLVITGSINISKESCNAGTYSNFVDSFIGETLITWPGIGNVVYANIFDNLDHIQEGRGTIFDFWRDYIIASYFIDARNNGVFVSEKNSLDLNVKNKIASKFINNIALFENLNSRYLIVKNEIDLSVPLLETLVKENPDLDGTELEIEAGKIIFENKISRKSDYEKSAYEIEQALVKVFRREFSNNMRKLYKLKLLNCWTSIENRIFPITEKAHIVPVEFLKKEKRYTEISDPLNGLILEPNIHKLWDKGYIEINSNLVVTTLSGQNLNMKLDEIHNNEDTKKYLSERIEIEKNKNTKPNNFVKILKLGEITLNI